MAIKKSTDPRPGGSGAAAAAAQKMAGGPPRLSGTGGDASTTKRTTSPEAITAKGGMSSPPPPPAFHGLASSSTTLTLSSSTSSARRTNDDVEALLPYTTKEKHSLRVLQAELSHPKLSAEAGDQLWKEHVSNVVSVTEKVLKFAAEHYHPSEPPPSPPALEGGWMGHAPSSVGLLGGAGVSGGSSTTGLPFSGAGNSHSGTGGGFFGLRRIGGGSFSGASTGAGGRPGSEGNGGGTKLSTPTGTSSNGGGGGSTVEERNSGAGGGGGGGRSITSPGRTYSFVSFMSVTGPTDWNGDLSFGGDDRRTVEEKKADFLAENAYIMSQLRQLQWCPFTALRLVEVLLSPLQYHTAKHPIRCGGCVVKENCLRGTKLQDTVRRCVLVTGGFYNVSEE